MQLAVDPRYPKMELIFCYVPDQVGKADAVDPYQDPETFDARVRGDQVFMYNLFLSYNPTLSLSSPSTSYSPFLSVTPRLSLFYYYYFVSLAIFISSSLFLSNSQHTFSPRYSIFLSLLISFLDYLRSLGFRHYPRWRYLSDRKCSRFCDQILLIKCWRPYIWSCCSCWFFHCRKLQG